MTRKNIDYGIDIGTTNSRIAVYNGKEVEVIKNEMHSSYTPSLVWINNKDHIYVGGRAKEARANDSENVYGDMKSRMGTPTQYIVKSTGRPLYPQELTAIILKWLIICARSSIGEGVPSAVITVPAYYTAPQIDAVRQAADIAEIKRCYIIPDPVAVSMAYGYHTAGEGGLWMVYDFGGGAFSAAIMSGKGEISILGYEVDSTLSGDSIDGDIVEHYFIPYLKRKYALLTFDKDNEKWRNAYARLKCQAEKARISPCIEGHYDICIDLLCLDEAGKPVRFEYELKREDLKKLIKPYIERTVDICDRILKEKGLKRDDIRKILLAGGGTNEPLVKQMLTEQLGIRLEYSIDPLLVVVKGAAIYASMMPLDPALIEPGYQASAERVHTPEDWDSIVGEATRTLEFSNNAIMTFGKDSEKSSYSVLEAEISRAIAMHEAGALKENTRRLSDFCMSILYREPDFWVMYFRQLCEAGPTMTNNELANKLISQGKKAIDTGDLESLKQAVYYLNELLVKVSPDYQKSYISNKY
jgi:molecular chaperone DnaK